MGECLISRTQASLTEALRNITPPPLENVVNNGVAVGGAGWTGSGVYAKDGKTTSFVNEPAFDKISGGAILHLRPKDPDNPAIKYWTPFINQYNEDGNNIEPLEFVWNADRKLYMAITSPEYSWALTTPEAFKSEVKSLFWKFQTPAIFQYGVCNGVQSFERTNSEGEVICNHSFMNNESFRRSYGRFSDNLRYLCSDIVTGNLEEGLFSVLTVLEQTILYFSMCVNSSSQNKYNARNVQYFTNVQNALISTERAFKDIVNVDNFS